MRNEPQRLGQSLFATSFSWWFAAPKRPLSAGFSRLLRSGFSHWLNAKRHRQGSPAKAGSRRVGWAPIPPAKAGGKQFSFLPICWNNNARRKVVGAGGKGEVFIGRRFARATSAYIIQQATTDCAVAEEARRPMIRFAVNAAIFCFGLVWVARRKQRIWRDLSWTVALVAALIGLESLIGMFCIGASDESTIVAVHRWFAHALVILVWCLVVAAIAAGMLWIRARPFAAIGVIALVVMTFLLVVFESITGYLPSGLDLQHPDTEESLNRFYVLHCAALPCVIIVAMVIGALILRKAGRAFNASDRDGPVRPVISENPYSSPSSD